MTTTIDEQHDNANSDPARGRKSLGQQRKGGNRRSPHVRVAIVGSGFSGLGTAIRLHQEGMRDFLVFERAGEVGGTWRDNSYPGCACDVMSLLYSFSFAPNPNWSTTFGKRDEVLAYLRDCVDRFEIREHLRLDHELLEARWDDEAKLWNIVTSQGNYTAQVLVTGTGYLSEPAIPAISGLDSFTGEVFHSARWNHDVDLSGKRVAVIGTGASAVQFVPKIQPHVAHLDVFQRTPAWVAPKADKKISSLQVLLRKRIPGYQKFRRTFNKNGREILAFMMAHPAIMEKTIQGNATKHLQQQIGDPELRARLTPHFTAGCKRLLFSNDFYPALSQSNVDVVTEGITKVTPDAVVSADGTERAADVIILGTGFRATDRPVAHRITGRDGRSLAETWQRGMSAYLGTTVAGFPNLFMLLGPNTTLGHSSQTVIIEAQIEYLVDALHQIEQRGLATVEPREQAQAAYNNWLDRKLVGTVWNAGNCQSWYLDASGRNPSIWPTYTWKFRRRTRSFDLRSYRLVSSADSTVAAARSAAVL